MSMPNKDKQMDQVMHKDATKIEHQKIQSNNNNNNLFITHKVH